QDVNARARQHVAARGAVAVALLLEVTVHRGRDVYGERLNAEQVDHELRVLETLGARGAVRHPHTDHVVLAERLDGQEGGERRIHSPRQPYDPFSESPAAHDFVLQETHQPAAPELAVD